MDPDTRKKIPQSESVLPGGSELGEDGIAALPRRLARYAQAHQRALRMADYATEHGERKVAARLRKCGHWLLFRHYYTVDKLRLLGADFCRNHLLCPLCAMRRAVKYLRAYMDRLAVVMADNPDLRAYMVTLTVRDGPDLAERFDHLRAGIGAMIQARLSYLSDPERNRYVEMVKALGGVYSIEVKRGANSGLWHPHVHMVWLCREAPDRDKLSREWLRWTGDSYIVDVRPVHGQGDMASGFVEVFKYALKFSDLELADNWIAYKSLRGRRLINSFGVLRGVSVPDDLTDEPLDDMPWVDLVYRWAGSAGYSLVDVERWDDVERYAPTYLTQDPEDPDSHHSANPHSGLTNPTDTAACRPAHYALRTPWVHHAPDQHHTIRCTPQMQPRRRPERAAGTPPGVAGGGGACRGVMLSRPARRLRRRARPPDSRPPSRSREGRGGRPAART